MAKKAIRLLLVGQRGGFGLSQIVGEREGARYAVCIGEVPRPNRRCEWRVVAFCKTIEEAKRRHANLEPRLGRALVCLDDPAVLLVDQDQNGRVDPGKALEREAREAIGKPYALRVPAGRNCAEEEWTVLAYPVGEHFAIHRMPGKAESCWRVTHLPSRLYAVGRCSGKILAAAFALCLQRIDGISWDSLTPHKGPVGPWEQAGKLTKCRSFDDLLGVLEAQKVGL